MNNKLKPNRYKPTAGEKTAFMPDSTNIMDLCLKTIMIVAGISILSLSALFAHDFIIQSPFFNIKAIEITGIRHIQRQEILELADLTTDKNIFGLNCFLLEKKVNAHAWVKSATVKRILPSELHIVVTEQEPLAIVKIENLSDILINSEGQPFKEYDPLTDRLKNIPVITGVDLTRTDNQYLFNSYLFNSIMDFLKIDGSDTVRQIIGNEQTGITIETPNIYSEPNASEMIQIKLGFDNFTAKLKKAKIISEYIDTHYPDRTIWAMDLFKIEKVFIKTKVNTALHNNLEKGV